MHIITILVHESEGMMVFRPGATIDTLTPHLRSSLFISCSDAHRSRLSAPPGLPDRHYTESGGGGVL